MLGECKWTNRPVGIDMLGDLERKARLVSEELDSQRLLFGLRARNGSTPQVEEKAAKRETFSSLTCPISPPETDLGR